MDSGMTVRHLQSLQEEIFLKRMEFNLIVSDPATLQEALELVSILDLPNLFFKPVFTGNNLDFFRENVFVSLEEILASKPSQQQVFSRMTINENDFGKLWVLPEGEVHANLNDPPLGLVKNEYLHQLVLRELDSKSSWGRTRTILAPCKGCVYQFLCPPVSSYEIFMNRYNFCDVILNEQDA
jgi:pseudo-rSAM protein